MATAITSEMAMMPAALGGQKWRRKNGLWSRSDRRGVRPGIENLLEPFDIGIGRRVPGGTMEVMVGVLLLLFLVVPLAELYVIIQVGHVFGALNTVALLIVVSAVGAWLVKREGISVWRRFQRQIESGAVPGREIADGVMILFAGALLLSPGFLTDIFAVFLLLPPVRAVLRSTVLGRIARRTGIQRSPSADRPRGGWQG